MILKRYRMKWLHFNVTPRYSFLSIFRFAAVMDSYLDAEGSAEAAAVKRGARFIWRVLVANGIHPRPFVRLAFWILESRVERWTCKKRRTLFIWGQPNSGIEDIKNSLSHERGNERSERASERVSAAEGASEASSPEQANE